MKNYLKGLIGVFIVVGLIGMMYSLTMTDDDTGEQVVSDSYPSDLRGDITTSESKDTISDEEIEALLNEDLEPDENFEEFDIEGEAAPEDDISLELVPDTEPAPAAEPAPAEAPPQLVVSINVGKANLRSAPQAKSKIVEVVKRESSIVVLERGEDWSLCEVDGKQGYIKSRLLSFPE